jgi:undecaprenyl-diphosphatase
VPALAVPVGGLAAAVGASRVISRVHYPSDVLAGFALGTAAARGRPRASTPRCGRSRTRRSARGCSSSWQSA